MSSAVRESSQIPINKLYVNIAGIQSSIFDATGVTKAAWVVGVAALETGGSAVLRDMGKTLYLPNPSGAAQSTVMRKIQLVPSGTSGSFGTGGASGTEGTEFYTGYISLGGQTFGGGDGAAARVARLN